MCIEHILALKCELTIERAFTTRVHALNAKNKVIMGGDFYLKTFYVTFYTLPDIYIILLD